MVFYGNRGDVNAGHNNNRNFQNTSGNNRRQQRNWSEPRSNGSPDFRNFEAMRGTPPNFNIPPGHFNMMLPPANMNMMGPPINLIRPPFGSLNMVSAPTPMITSPAGFEQLKPPMPMVQQYHNIDVNNEIWVETKTTNGERYYYSMRTRETTWIKPDFPNIKIVPQNVIEASNVAVKTALGTLPGKFEKSPLGSPSVLDKAKQIKPEILPNASMWSEHKNEKGTLYYFNSKTGESVWEKPQVLKELETAKLTADQEISSKSKTTGDNNPVTATTTQEVTPIPAKQETEKKQPKAVSSACVPGTPWSVIYTSTGRVFFYNSLTKSSLWKRPADLMDRSDVDKLVEDPPTVTGEEEIKVKDYKKQGEKPTSCVRISDSPWSVVWTSDGRVFFYDVAAGKSVWERPDNLMGRSDVDEMVKCPPGKDSSTESKSKKRPAPDDLVSPNKKVKIERTMEEAAQKTKKDSISEAEERAAKERENIPYEERVKTFKEMLNEKGVSASSRWEKELRQIVFDPRYLLLISQERRQIFKEFVQERVLEEKKEKHEKLRKAKKAFKELLSESQLTGKSHFTDFSKKYANEERFKNIEKMRDREIFFNQYLGEIRLREKAEKLKREEQIKEDFLAMLKEHKTIDRHSHWSDVKTELKSDSRCEAVDSSEERKNLFEQYRKMLKAEKKLKKDKKQEGTAKKKKDSKKHEKKDRD